MIRYLGVGLGLAIGCGLCSATGTLIPAIIDEGKRAFLLDTTAGHLSLVGVIVSLAGIVLVGMAGMSKENELPEEQKKKAVAEYSFKKGILVAMFSGIMSAGMSFGLQGGAALEKLAQTTAPATSDTWRGMPVLVVVLLGGFVVNAIWCLYLNVRNKTLGDYTKSGAPIVGNLVFAGLAGAIWCSQFICFKTGEPRMADGPDGLRRLGRLDGQRHPFQHAPGHRPGRMERHQRPNPRAAGAGPGAAARLQRGRRLQRRGSEQGGRAQSGGQFSLARSLISHPFLIPD
jgi:hypothetical protein